MAEVTDYPTFKLMQEVAGLQQTVTDLTALVVGMLTMLSDRDILEPEDVLEARFAGEHAMAQDLMLGQPCDYLVQAALGYAFTYRVGPEGGAPADIVQAVLDERERQSQADAQAR